MEYKNKDIYNKLTQLEVIILDLYPLKFKPIYQKKIWGGKHLAKIFNRDLPYEKTGESWEISQYNNYISLVENGPLRGISLAELMKNNQEKLLGKNIKLNANDKFPLLIKFIDANQQLSVQVHPSDKTALRSADEQGKTEIWYIVAAKPGSELIFGLNQDLDRSYLKKAINNKKLSEYLQRVKVKAGDSYFIPAGTVHAIGSGILIAEIQQSSDTTFRLYDWGRVGKDGKPRTLHIERALDVINYRAKQKKQKLLTHTTDEWQTTFLATSPYFVTEKINLNGIYHIKSNGEHFYILIATQGTAELKFNDKLINFSAGETVLIPASIDITSLKGEIEFLMTYLPIDKEEIKRRLKSLNFSPDEIHKIPGYNLF